MPAAICLSVLMPSAQSKKILEKTGGTSISQVVSYKNTSQIAIGETVREVFGVGARQV
jgi:hypothetical protein